MLPQLNPDEQAVYDLIVNCPNRITQQQIAIAEPRLGSHSRHEGYMSEASTLRRIRQIIRDLRIIHGLFILSDKNGYWIMKEREEATKYLARIERVAKATAKGYFETYRAMQRNFSVKSEYFDTQMSLFEN
jgi:hypothetical protein